MIEDFLIGWAINTILTFLQISIKNPATKAKYQRALLKVRNAIDAAFPIDETPLP